MAILQYTDDRGTRIRWRWRTTESSAIASFSTRFRIASRDPLQCGVLVLFVLDIVCVATATVLYLTAHLAPILGFAADAVIVGLIVAAEALLVAAGILQWIVILTHRIQRRFREALLSTGRCPACMEQMSGVPVEEDGCVVCANADCRAAWRLSGRVAQE